MGTETGRQTAAIESVPLRWNEEYGYSFGVCPFCRCMVVEERGRETACEHYVNTGGDEEDGGLVQAFRNPPYPGRAA